MLNQVISSTNSNLGNSVKKIHTVFERKIQTRKKEIEQSKLFDRKDAVSPSLTLKKKKLRQETGYLKR